MLILFLSPSTGIIAKLVGPFGFKLLNLMVPFLGHYHVWSEAWQACRMGIVSYIATFSVDPTLYEAATMDGANKCTK